MGEIVDCRRFAAMRAVRTGKYAAAGLRAVVRNLQTCARHVAETASILAWIDERYASILRDTGAASRFCRECQDAMAQGDIEEMIRRRDRLADAGSRSLPSEPTSRMVTNKQRQ